MYYLTPQSLIEASLRQQRNILFVRRHGPADIEGEEFIIKNLATLQKGGVKSIFFEALADDIDPMKVAARTMPKARIDQIAQKVPRLGSAMKLMQLAEAIGIDVFGIDTDKFASRAPDKLTQSRQATLAIPHRDEHMAGQIKKLAKGRPYVILAGFLHASGLKAKLANLSVCAILPGAEQVISGSEKTFRMNSYFDEYRDKNFDPVRLPVLTSDLVLHSATEAAVDYIVITNPTNARREESSWLRAGLYGLGALALYGCYQYYQYKNDSES